MEKNTTMSLYIVSGVSLPHGAFVFKGCFSFFSFSFFFFFFWLDSESKTWLWSFRLEAQ